MKTHNHLQLTEESSKEELKIIVKAIESMDNVDDGLIEMQMKISMLAESLDTARSNGSYSRLSDNFFEGFRICLCEVLNNLSNIIEEHSKANIVLDNSISRQIGG